MTETRPVRGHGHANGARYEAGHRFHHTKVSAVLDSHFRS